MSPLFDISIEALTKRYDRQRVLDGLSLTVRGGEFLTLLGPSGSGKTTLLMALAGFVMPEAGSIHFGATDMTTCPPHRRGIGMVFQNYALFPFMSVAQNVAYPLRVRGVGRAESRRLVEEALARVDLAGFGPRNVDSLSGGQRQRVALARAIVFSPSVILMDEPLSALDKKLREQMQVEIKALHRQLSATIVYVTHDQREALTMSDRIAVMHRGGIAQIGRPEDVYARPTSRFVADFIGDAALLPVRVDSGALMYGGERIGVAPVAAPSEGYLVVRPEQSDLATGDPAETGPGQLRIGADLTDILYEGETILLFARTRRGDSLLIRRPVRDQPSLPDPGSVITVVLRGDSSVVVPDDPPAGAGAAA